MTRTEMYQTVRKTLEDIAFTDSTKRGHEIIRDNGISARKGIAVISALEAQEREAPDTGCDDDGSAISWALTGKTPEEIREYINRFNALTGEQAVAMVKAHRATVAKSATVQATPPAPPAAECAARKALEKVSEWLDHIATCPNEPCSINHQVSQHPDSKFLKPAVDAVRAALASPCCEGLRHQLAETTSRLDTANKQFASVCRTNMDVATELAAAKSEIARLTADRDKFEGALKCSNETAKRRGAELRQAVDALRRHRQGMSDLLEFRKLGDGRYGNLTREEIEGVMAEIEPIIAAYDAKHGEKA